MRRHSERSKNGPEVSLMKLSFSLRKSHCTLHRVNLPLHHSVRSEDGPKQLASVSSFKATSPCQDKRHVQGTASLGLWRIAKAAYNGLICGMSCGSQPCKDVIRHPPKIRKRARSFLTAACLSMNCSSIERPSDKVSRPLRLRVFGPEPATTRPTI